MIQSVAFPFLVLILYSKFTQSPFVFVNKIHFSELKICPKYFTEILKILISFHFNIFLKVLCAWPLVSAQCNAKSQFLLLRPGTATIHNSLSTNISEKLFQCILKLLKIFKFQNISIIMSIKKNKTKKYGQILIWQQIS